MNNSSLKLYLSALLAFCVTPISHAQINSNIPLMIQPMRIENPMLQMQQMEALRAQAAQARMMEEQAMELENQNRQMEAARAQASQARMMEEQARQNESQQNQRQQQKPDINMPSEKLMADWLKAAQPRLYLYPDFDKVVYASDVAITTDMIKLMSGSQYAADIAYYLGTHKTEASAIAQMPLLEQSQAISKIESRIKASPKKAS